MKIQEMMQMSNNNNHQPGTLRGSMLELEKEITDLQHQRMKDKTPWQMKKAGKRKWH